MASVMVILTFVYSFSLFFLSPPLSLQVLMCALESEGKLAGVSSLQLARSTNQTQTVRLGGVSPYPLAHLDDL